MIRGLISIGTNSTRALVADLTPDAPKTLLAASIGTRIGEGLRERGHLSETAMQRTLDAMGEHLHSIRERTDDLRVIATSALRRADNEGDFAKRVHALTGERLEIISGEEEAACSFTGAVSGLDARSHEHFGVLDVGGVSTEYATGTKSAPERAVSCEIGAVRLTEAFPDLAGDRGAITAETLDRAASQAYRALDPALELPHANRLVLVGGSATTAFCIRRGSRDPFAYGELSLQELDDTIALLRRLPLEERKALAGINPQRADILLAGLLVVRCAVTRMKKRSAVVSTSDVLLGYLLRHPAKL